MKYDYWKELVVLVDIDVSMEISLGALNENESHMFEIKDIREQKTFWMADNKEFIFEKLYPWVFGHMIDGVSEHVEEINDMNYILPIRELFKLAHKNGFFPENIPLYHEMEGNSRQLLINLLKNGKLTSEYQKVLYEEFFNNDLEQNKSQNG